MKLIDTHCHLFLEEFDSDRKELIHKSVSEGIEYFILPNVDVQTIDSLLETCKISPDRCLPAIGLHPCSVKQDYKEQLKIHKSYLQKQKFIAVGEIGVDLYWDKTTISEQLITFEQQLQWAKEYNLPVIIHNRDAFNETYNVVKNNQGITGVFHAFSGSAEQAQKVIELGFYVGIGGVVTFKNGKLDKVIPHIPLSKVILETDAPYLTPVPFRGKRNEPLYMKYIVSKLAEIYGLSEDEIATVTTHNAKQLFNI